MIINRLFRVSKQAETEAKKASVLRNLIRREAKIGGELFGPVRPGGRREFFCLDEHTAIWHEEWLDNLGKLQVRTTRYDARPQGVLKAQNGQPYQMVSAQEAKNLRAAIELYAKKVTGEIYKQSA
jgi:hypothetical protein